MKWEYFILAAPEGSAQWVREYLPDGTITVHGPFESWGAAKAFMLGRHKIEAQEYRQQGQA